MIDSWKQEAKRRGVSMQELLKQAINDNAPARTKTFDEILKGIDELRAKTGPEKSNLALEIIREGRDNLEKKLKALGNETSGR